ncbi:MAG TPA: hypothetical protein VKA64_00620 [Gammaproteobacteria bacterium]|nr:hypothetical protein [Gammaproteobacteria bacterium]
MSEPREIVITGLDGVLALLEHRLHHLYNEEGIKHWDRFLEACTEDMPNLPLIDRLNHARDSGVPVIILTGRSAAVRAQTEQWLARWQIGFDALWMRPADNRKPAVAFKTAVIEQHYAGYSVRRVYESEVHLDIARWCEQQAIACTVVGHNQGNGEDREQLDLKVIRHACDHVMLHPFYGDDDFTWDDRAEQLGQAACRLCAAEEQESERRKKAGEARLQARERGLPPLEGSDKQVAWAETIRLNAFGAIDKVLKWLEEVDDQAAEEDPDHWGDTKRAIHRSIEYLEEQVEAKWWIDHRNGIMNSLDGGRSLLSAVAQEMGYF